MRILMLTSSYPHPDDLSWGPFVQKTAQSIVQYGCDVRILAMSPDETEGLQKDDQGLDVYWYAYAKNPLLHAEPGIGPSLKKHKAGWLQLPSFVHKTRTMLAKQIEEWKPDVIHAHWLSPGGWLAAPIAKKYAIPLVTTAWGEDMHFRWPLSLSVKNIGKSAAAVTYVSKYLQERGQLQGIQCAYECVIPNVVDIETFCPNDQEKYSDRLALGVIARLIPNKHVEIAIQAIAQLSKEEQSSLDLSILGTGPEKQRLQKMVHDYDLNDSITFKDTIPHADVPNFLRSLDLLLHMSTQEGMNTSILEAMACGTPVCAAQAAATDEEITPNETGFLYPALDAAALASYIRAVLQDRSQLVEMGKGARQSIVEHFSMEHVGRLYADLFKKILQRRK